MPIKVRRQLGANRLRLYLKNRKVILEPIEGLEEVFGKYKGLFGKKTMEEIEEEEEEFVFREKGLKRKT